MKKISLLVILLLGMLAAVGCNTVRGMGKDVEEVGDSVKDAAT
ncbi:MAG: entericidin A/B family lipoprotein [Kiritimatiellia bacterium]